MSAHTNIQKKALRKKIRAQRRSLSLQYRQKANRQLVKQLFVSSQLLTGKNIALYLGNDGEICPRNLIDELLRWRRKVYLPVIHPLFKNRMIFCQITHQTKYIKNQFGISEPEFKHAVHIQSRFLSTVFMPLVAFDEKGNRMGMGGGFYDRTFHFKKKSEIKTPKLIGLAYEFQKVESLPTEAWDIPMHGVATEDGFYKF